MVPSPLRPSTLLLLFFLYPLFLSTIIHHTTTTATATSRFPSILASWILPGFPTAPTDPETLLVYPTADSVQRWELLQTDAAFGGSIGDPNETRSITSVGYMYNQMLEYDPGDKEMWLRQRALDFEEDYESFFLHFSVDTTFVLEHPEHSTKTSLVGRPWVVGWTASETHSGFWLYQEPPWADVPAWSDAASKGGLHVWSFERFDELSLTLSGFAADGRLVVQYPSMVAPTIYGVERHVVQWSNLTNLTDGTNGLRQSGKVRFTPPDDWVMAATHDGSRRTYGGGPHMVNYYKGFLSPFSQTTDGRHRTHVEVVVGGMSGKHTSISCPVLVEWLLLVS